jgi:hypothetical protein
LGGKLEVWKKFRKEEKEGSERNFEATRKSFLTVILSELRRQPNGAEGPMHRFDLQGLLCFFHRWTL